MTYERFDVVVVPFPFAERKKQKRRPALVLSDSRGFNNSAGHLILAMITSARHSSWPLDVPILDLSDAGLSSPSVVRMKLFTLPVDLVLRRCGSLSENDRATTEQTLNRLWGKRRYSVSGAHDVPEVF
ncbi:MAG: type II toxin-antitoxin system PemK/MazF family toxin [bacterium]|nr:type II toxin-antitoxin system PemK/MazF family toxin [bacterium]